MKKIIIAYVALIIVLIILAVFRTNIFGSLRGLGNPFSGVLQRSNTSNTGTTEGSITINDKKFNLYVADTVEELQKGLSGRDNLKDDEGMLFVFSEKGEHAFWMRDMKFPIDIIFINDNKIVDIYRNVQPPEDNSSTSQLPTYAPSEPSNYVLEVKAGLSEKNDITEGDTVKIEGLN